MQSIYVASKTRHAPLWRLLRDQGLPINSTWIDEAGPGESTDLSDLWRRCIAEASSADAILVYRESNDVLKGAWAEMGAALACRVPVYAVGIEEFTISNAAGVTNCTNLSDAVALLTARPTPSPDGARPEGDRAADGRSPP